MYYLHPQFRKRGFQYGGEFRVNEENQVISFGFRLNGSYFVIRFSDNQGSILKQIEEVRAVVRKVLQDTEYQKLILVGFSMGGLVARSYLTKYLKDHHIHKMVSIGSPHQGSNWARMYSVIDPIRKNCEKKKLLSYLYDWTICPLVNQIESLGGNVRLNSPAIRDLRPPEWRLRVTPEVYDSWKKSDIPQKDRKCVLKKNGDRIFNLYHYVSNLLDSCRISYSKRDWWLRNLPLDPHTLVAKLMIAEHPKDVIYVSMVSEIKAPKDFRELMDTTAELYEEQVQGKYYATVNKVKMLVYLKNLVSLMSSNPTWSEGSDGAVSVSSQDLSKLPWFRNHIISHEVLQHMPTESILYHTDGLPHPLRIEKVKAHHMEAVYNHEGVFRSIFEVEKVGTKAE